MVSRTMPWSTALGLDRRGKSIASTRQQMDSEALNNRAVLHHDWLQRPSVAPRTGWAPRCIDTRHLTKHPTNCHTRHWETWPLLATDVADVRPRADFTQPAQ
jgi:hypothetical protein